MSRSVKTLVYAAVSAALVFVATAFIKIPTGIGYANLGDGLILMSGALLAPWPCAAAAAVGSALSDLMAGYIVYAPVTLAIKGLMGFVCAFGLQKKQKPVLTFVLCEAIMMAGYFVFEWPMYGFAGAVGSLLPNLGQAAVGVVLGCVLQPVALKIKENVL